MLDGIHRVMPEKVKEMLSQKEMEWQKKTHYLVAVVIPVSNEKVVLRLGFGEGHIDDHAVVDADRSITSRRFLEVDGGEIEESANLILGLEHISPVCARQYRAVGARNPVLPRVEPLLYAVPAIDITGFSSLVPDM